MIVTNEYHPELTPVTSLDAIPIEWVGDKIRITYGPGKFEIKEHLAVVASSPAEAVYKTINKMMAIKMVIKHAGMDHAAEEAMYDDPNLSLSWKRWDKWVPYEGIRRESEDVAEFLGGLVIAGHMTQTQVDNLMAAWPQV